MEFFRTLVIIILAFNLSNCVDKDISNKKPEVDTEKLLKAITKFNKAFQDGNTVVLESMITENYFHTNGNSKAIRKKDWFNYLNKRTKEIESGNLEVLEYKMDETEIEFYGNIAIVTGKIIISNNKNKEIKKNEYRITNVWVNESGNWKRAGFHDGKIK